ncbi:MAG: restriction endonuclease [Roseiflexaceae bacterium]
MGVDTTERRDPREVESSSAAGDAAQQGVFGRLTTSLTTGLRELKWQPVLLFGVLSGILMSFSILQGTGNILGFFTGLVPVGAGLLIGRRVKAHHGLHGFVTGLIGAAVSVIGIYVLLFLTPLGTDLINQAASQGISPELATPQNLLVQFAGLSAFSLITFVSFGASISGRTEQRNQQLRAELERRGGRLERPSAVRTLEDLRGLSLPQFGSYVRNLFQKHGFQFKDYRFIDKDKHLDLWMEHEGEVWHLRLTVADKVNPGSIEGLNQELRREGLRKGVVVTSTEFTPSALKSGKNHRSLVLIDGPTLYEIAEK